MIEAHIYLFFWKRLIFNFHLVDFDKSSKDTHPDGR